MMGKGMVGALMALAGAASHAGVTLVENGGFDESLSGWTVMWDRPAAWDAQDASGDPLSGSAVLTNNMATGNNAFMGILQQCLPVTGGETLVFGAHAQTPAGQPYDNIAGVLVYTYSGDVCVGDALQAASAISGAPGPWQALQGSLDVDPAARRAAIILAVGKPAGVTGPTLAAFDNVFAVAFGDVLFADGFED